MSKLKNSFDPFQLVFARKTKFQLWPALILGEASLMEGFKVYFFRSKEVYEIPRKNMIIRFNSLLDKDVSFRIDKGWKKGRLMNYKISQTCTTPQFYVVTNKGEQYSVGFFDLFLTTKQANQILPEAHSKTSLFSL